MSRRKQSLFEDLIDVTAMFPWWVGVVLAVGFYFGLHQVAIMEVAAPISTKGMGDFVGKQLYKTFATYLQYILSAAFLIGSVVSVFSRHKRNALHSQVVSAGVKSALEGMSWLEFEQLVGEFFRRKGFVVEETGGGGADGGVDLVLSRGADRHLVQCKQWKARQVGVTTVRELYGVMAAKGAAGGYVVTSGVFTDEAKRFAEGREIALIGGDRLTALIGEQSASVEAPGARGSSVGGAHPTRLDTGLHRYDGQNVHEESLQRTDSPTCPQCGSTMILRTARKGPQAGSSFWGCSKFPACRATRPV